MFTISIEYYINNKYFVIKKENKYNSTNNNNLNKQN